MKYFWILAIVLIGACSTQESETPEIVVSEGENSAPVLSTPDQSLAAQNYIPIKFADIKATPAERAKCEKVGGTVRQAGMMRAEHCIQKMEDAGLVCRNSTDCVSRCILPPEKDGVVKPGDTTTGVCAATDEVFGCFTEVKNGKIGFALCVD